MSNSSIWPIDRTLAGARIPGQSETGSNGNEDVLRITQSSSTSDRFASYTGHCRDSVGVFYSPSWLAIGHSLGKDLTFLQRFSWCILQHQLTGPQDIRWERVLLFCRDSVGVFYSPSWLGHSTLVGKGSYFSAEIQLVFSTAPSDWTTGHSSRKGFTFLQRFSWCILQPPPTGWKNIAFKPFLNQTTFEMNVFTGQPTLSYEFTWKHYLWCHPFISNRDAHILVRSNRISTVKPGTGSKFYKFHRELR